MDIVHVLMGVAMAGVLVPRLSTLPDGAWEATFGAAVAWFGWHAVRAYRAGGTGGKPAHQLPHLLASGAMLYMFLAVTPARTGPPVTAIGMAGGPAGTARFPVLALALALALFGYVMWITDRLASVPAVAAIGLALAGAGPARPGTGSPGRMTAVAAQDRWPGMPRRAGMLRPGRPWPRRGVPLSPRLAACCEIVMGITMGYMLIVML